MPDQPGMELPVDLPICLPQRGPNDLTILLVIVSVVAGLWLLRRWFLRRRRQSPRTRRF